MDPSRLETRGQDARVTVILNVWNDHVFTYNTDVGAPPDVSKDNWADESLLKAADEEDTHCYDEMLPLAWPELMEAWHERRKTVFWTTEPIKSLEDALRANGLSFVPRYSAPDQCNVVDVPFAAKRRSYVRIKRLPEDHLELRAFCQRVQDELRLKLYYKGESAAVIGHKFVHEFLVRKREAIPEADKKALMDKQDGRCAKCNDVLDDESV